MIKRLFFFTILFISLLTSCVAKKTTTEYKEFIQKDSTHNSKETTVIQAVVDTLFIESPCDSLGNLKPFAYSLVLPQGRIDLSGINNTIQGKFDLKGYEKTVETKYKLMYEKRVSEITKKTVILKTPLWAYIAILLQSLIIFLLFKFK